MAASIAKQCSIFVDGYDLSCAFKELKMAKSVDEHDTTALCTTGDRTFLPGLKQGNLSLSGFYAFDDTLEDQVENILETAFNAQETVVITASLGSRSVGGVAFMCRGGQTKHDVESVLNTVLMVTADITAEDNVFAGKFIFDSDVDKDTEVGTSIDNAAASTNGGVLHVHAYAHDEDISDSSILLEQSANNSAWTTLIASTDIGAPNGALAIEVAPGTTVARYLRLTITAADGAASYVAAFYRG